MITITIYGFQVSYLTLSSTKICFYLFQFNYHLPIPRMLDLYNRSAKQFVNSVALSLFPGSTTEIVPQDFAIINVNIEGGLSLGTIIILNRIIVLIFRWRWNFYCTDWNNNTVRTKCWNLRNKQENVSNLLLKTCIF